MTDKPELVCQCCGERDAELLRRLPKIMSDEGAALGAPLSATDKFICVGCFGIWYDEGITDIDEIGARRRAQIATQI